jgi:hypothetical protein
MFAAKLILAQSTQFKLNHQLIDSGQSDGFFI